MLKTPSEIDKNLLDELGLKVMDEYQMISSDD
jgi:hypothetical protein